MTARSSYREQGSLTPIDAEDLLGRAQEAVRARRGFLALFAPFIGRLAALLIRVGLAGMLLMLGGMLVPLLA